MADDEIDLSSLATFLHLTPAQVDKMASRGKVPGRRVNGEWRFYTSEINEWFEQRIGASSPEELEHVELLLEPGRSTEELAISQLLQPGSIWINFAAKTRNSVVDRICSAAADAGLMWEQEKFAEAIRAREVLHSTALDNGVALLHPRRPMHGCLMDPFLALGITSSGIPFGGPRGILTDVFFLIGSINDQAHLRTIARLSRLISIPNFLDQLRQAPDANEAWQLIHDTDQALDA